MNDNITMESGEDAVFGGELVLVSYSSCIRRRYAIRRDRTWDLPVPGPEEIRIAGALDWMAWSWVGSLYGRFNLGGVGRL